MKKKILLFVITSSVLAISSSAYATSEQENPKDINKQQPSMEIPAQEKQHEDKRLNKNVDSFIKIIGNLDLSKEQEKKLLALREERKVEKKLTQKEFISKTAALLSKDQRKKLVKLMQERRKKREER